MASPNQAFDEFKEHRRCCGDGIDEPRADYGAEHGLEGVRVVLDARDDLAAIHPGRARADLRAFKDHHVATGLRQMQGGTQPRIARADDHRLGAARGAKRAAVGPR
jgi:hypothetical protein